jgi:hypothetical protein
VAVGVTVDVMVGVLLGVRVGVLVGAASRDAATARKAIARGRERFIIGRASLFFDLAGGRQRERA